MSSEKTDSAGLWAWIGKASTLIAVIWGLIRIASTFLPVNEYKIEANGYCTRIAFPETLFGSGVPDSVKNDLRDLESIWWITIENKGAKEVHDLSLELPFDGRYRIEQIGATSIYTDFQKIVPIGSLRPSHEINVTLWAGPAYFPLHTWCIEGLYDDTKITHPNGVIKIRYTEKVTGLLARFIQINRDFRSLPSVAATFLAVILVIALVLLVCDKCSGCGTDENNSG